MFENINPNFVAIAAVVVFVVFIGWRISRSKDRPKGGGGGGGGGGVNDPKIRHK